MGVRLNPLSGNFDFTGTSDAAPFAGQVDAYADLPLGTTAALNSRWLVKNNSGTWPFSTYKQGGIYIRVNTVGASRDTDYQFVGTLPSVMNDSEFLVYDDTDATKNLKFQLSGITTGTTRTLTAPDASGRIQLEGQAIGDTTPAAGTFTTLRINSTSTLEAGIGRPNLGVMGFNRQDAPSTYHFAHGFDGTNRAAFCSDVTFFGWASGNATSVSSCDIRLFRDAAGTLGQRNTTNAQTFNIYNTFTSSTNHERGFLKWSSNVFQIGTEKGSGGGTARALEFQTDGSTRMTIGAAGGTTNFGDFTLPQANRLRFSASGTRIAGASDGLLRISNGAENDFDRLQFGGTTTSFPALKRSSTVLQARLANDSDFCPLQGQLRIHQNAVSETITATHTLTLFDAAGTAYKVPCVAA
jgi:hypothetical protein